MHTRILTYVYIYIYIRIHTYRYGYVYVCVYVCVCMYVCMYIYIYIYIYSRMYLQVCIYRYVYMHNRRRARARKQRSFCQRASSPSLTRNCSSPHCCRRTSKEGGRSDRGSPAWYPRTCWDSAGDDDIQFTEALGWRGRHPVPLHPRTGLHVNLSIRRRHG